MSETPNAGPTSALSQAESAAETEARREPGAPVTAEKWVQLGQRQLQMGQGEQAIASFRHATTMQFVVCARVYTTRLWRRWARATKVARYEDALVALRRSSSNAAL